MDNKLYKLMNWPEIESIVYSECDHPEKILGMHEAKGGQLIQCFFPHAVSVNVKNLTNSKEYEMEKVDEEGFFAVLCPEKNSFSYEYIVFDTYGKPTVHQEIYRIIPQFWLNLADKLKAGNFYDSYRYFGAHFCERKGILGTEFMVYAPGAVRVSVVGDFNMWDGRINQMCRINELGVFGLFIPGAGTGSLYKYEIKLANGLTFVKRDPYALSLEKGNGDAGRIIEDPQWEVVKYKRTPVSSGFSILNISLRNFKASLEKNADLANELVKLIKKFGYDSVLFEDLSICTKRDVTQKGKLSFFAVCPEVMRLKDLVGLVDKLHAASVKVLSTIDLSSFIPDNAGLRGFDGTRLFEGDNTELNNLLTFDFNNPFVRNYLISVCDYFVKALTLDGIAVAGMDRILYLDYGRAEGEYKPNIYGGNESIKGIEFIKDLNEVLHKRYSNVITIAKDSLVSNNLTRPLEEDGLGFDYKIHTQFDKDLFAYLSNDFEERKKHHSELTYSPVYMHCEKFILSYLNEDYGSSETGILSKLPGKVMLKEKGFRLAISYLFMHPGRKCLSQWSLFSDKYVELIRSLISLYKENSVFSGNDDSEDCFEWINAIDSEHSVVSFMRSHNGNEALVVCNFSDCDLNYHLGVKEGVYKEIFSSDLVKFGGSSRLSGRFRLAKPSKKDGRKFELTINLGALSLHVYEKSSCQNKDS